MAWVRLERRLCLAFVGDYCSEFQDSLVLVPVAIVARFTEIGIKNKNQRKKIAYIALASLAAGALLITALPGPRGRMIDLRNEVRSIEGKVMGNKPITGFSYGRQELK